MQDDNKQQQTLYYRPWENLKEEKLNGKKVLRLPAKVVANLEHKQYGVYGHSAVQICSWTKKSLSGRGVCYKQKFYGIECHACMEFSPAAMWCQQNCTFCWRPMEFMKNIEINPDEVDDPEEIMEYLFEKRRKLLSGMGGHKDANRALFDKSFKELPSHYAISLSGEPTMYPKLDKMIAYLKTIPRTKSIFLVTNAQIPDFFEKLKENPQTLPTQLYISVDAPTKEIFDKINISLHSDGFERLERSLKIVSGLDTRKVIRFTQLKGLNDLPEHLEGYKHLISISNADFVEIKAYVHIGMSRSRHTKEQSPRFDEVENFAKLLAEYLGNYEYVASAPNSNIVLLRKKDTKYKVYIEKFEH